MHSCLLLKKKATIRGELRFWRFSCLPNRRSLRKFFFAVDEFDSGGRAPALGPPRPVFDEAAGPFVGTGLLSAGTRMSS